MEKDNKNIKSILKEMESKFGEGSVMNFDSSKIKEVEVISSGSLLLDKALGVGGYPKGRIIEIFGPESSGKTTMTLLAIAEAQKAGKKAAFIDAEHAIDPKWAQLLGVNLKDLVISQPDSGEQAFEILDHLTTTGLFDLIVIDSVAALVPTVELEGTAYDQTIGAQARLMSKGLRKISGSLNKTGTTVIFINQIREKIGVMFGNPETTPGGRALKFYSTMRLDIRLRERLKDKDVFIGQRVKIKVVKNKAAPPYKEAQPIINYSYGIDKFDELVELATGEGIVERAGSWYSYNGTKIGQGKDAAISYIKENKLYDEIYKKLFGKK